MPNSEIQTVLGGPIRRCRRGCDLTQPQLAAVVGVSPKQIYMIEKGATNPNTMLFLRICKALRTSPDVLLGWNEDE